MTFEDTMELVVQGFEVAGVLILVLGSLWAFGRYGLALTQERRDMAYQQVRHEVGRAILLGLEILIIADIILTVTIDPTIGRAAVLGLIVLVRTFLSFSIEVELEGDLPWRRAARRQALKTEGSET